MRDTLQGTGARPPAEIERWGQYVGSLTEVPSLLAALGVDPATVLASAGLSLDSLSAPVPLELFAFGLPSTLARLGPEVELRDAPRSPDDGVIADYRGEIGDPAALAARLEADPGVAAHGLFPADMVTDLVLGRGGSVDHSKLREGS